MLLKVAKVFLRNGGMTVETTYPGRNNSKDKPEDLPFRMIQQKLKVNITRFRPSERQ